MDSFNGATGRCGEDEGPHVHFYEWTDKRTGEPLAGRIPCAEYQAWRRLSAITTILNTCLVIQHHGDELASAALQALADDCEHQVDVDPDEPEAHGLMVAAIEAEKRAKALRAGQSEEGGA